MVMNTVAAPTTEFADPPSREDMQNYRQLFYPARPTALKRHLQRVEDNKPPSQRRRVFVMSEMPVRLLPARDSDRFYVPDLTVAFDVDEVYHRPRQRLRDHPSGQPAGIRAGGGVEDDGEERRQYQARRIRGSQNRGVLAHRPVRRRVARRAPRRRPSRTRRQIRPHSHTANRRRNPARIQRGAGLVRLLGARRREVLRP